MSDDLVKRVARSWASIDGKPYGNKEAEAGGYTEGYNADAEELLRRSGIASHIEQVRAEAHAAAVEAAMKLGNIVEYDDRPGWAHSGSWVHCAELYRMRIRTLHTDASREHLAERDERIKREAREEALRDMLGLTINHAPERGDIHAAITALIEKEGV